MSFSQEVRQELSTQIPSARHCRLAELAMMISLAGEILPVGEGGEPRPRLVASRTSYGIFHAESRSGEMARPASMTRMSESRTISRIIKIRTENLFVARKCFTLLKKTFNISVDVSVHILRSEKKSDWIYTVLVKNPEEAEHVLRALKMADDAVILAGAKEERFTQPFSGKAEAIMETPPPAGRRQGASSMKNRFAMAEAIDPLLVQQPCCRRACIRGAFLCAGSISNPEKFYHFEIVCPTRSCAGQLQALIHSFGPDAKIVQRKSHYIVYIKEGAQIVDMLNIMEAHVSLMNLENIRIVREMRNSVNRKVNCEAANINKTVNASVRQAEDIRFLIDRIGLEQLPPILADIARLRLEHPDASLAELGDMLTPPIGKSGVNHRLRKLGRLAEQVRESEE